MQENFTFRLSAAEKAEVITNCDHLARLKFAKSLPSAFTEHGALMAANVLSSPRAVEVSVFVVRAFVRLRETLAVHSDLARKLGELEKKTESPALKHDGLATETRAQFKQVIEALRQLMSPPAVQRRSIGFITPKNS